MLLANTAAKGHFPRMTETTATPPMKVAIIPVTPLQQNCTLVWCTKTMRGAFIDAGGDIDRLKLAVERSGVTIEKLLVTHGHIDHCGSTGILAKDLGVPIEGPHEADRYWIAKLDEDGKRWGITGEVFEPDRWLSDGDKVTIGELEARRDPLPRPHPGPRRVLSRALEIRGRRRRAVPGLDRAHRLSDGQSPAADRFDHAEALAIGQRHHVRARTRSQQHVRSRTPDQFIRQRLRARLTKGRSPGGKAGAAFASHVQRD